MEDFAREVLKDTQDTIDHANKLEGEFKVLEAKANGNSSDFETRIQTAKTDLILLETKYDKINKVYDDMLAASKYQIKINYAAVKQSFMLFSQVYTLYN